MATTAASARMKLARGRLEEGGYRVSCCLLRTQFMLERNVPDIYNLSIPIVNMSYCPNAQPRAK